MAKECQPDLLQKRKVHLLLHLVECMKEFGPTAGFNTEKYAVEFCPLRDAGPHVPLSEVNALSLFEFICIRNHMDSSAIWE